MPKATSPRAGISKPRGAIPAALAILFLAIPLSFTLYASAAAGSALQLSPEKLDFGKKAMNTVTGPQTVAVTNTGTAAVSLYQIISSGVDFKQSNNCPAALAAGASCSIAVVFQPASDGAREGAVIIFADDSISPHTIVVTGVGE